MFKTNDYNILTMQDIPQTKIPYGIKMLGVELEWVESKGKGIKVAVLDTGCPNHKDIIVRESFIATGLSNVTEGDVFDRIGHSTHVCGTICANGNILGAAPEIDLYTAKVLDDTGNGNDNTLTQGVYWAINKGVDIINMSLGGQNPQSKLYEAIKTAINKGIIIVCASGNSGENYIGYPAKFPETIAVAAVDIKKEHPDFSSIGEEVEVVAAGVDVLSTWLDNKYATLHGTSMACPHITGAVALFQAKAKIRYGRKLTLNEIRLLLHMYSEDLGTFGKDDKFGFGLFSFGRIEKTEEIKHTIKMQIDNKKYYVDGIEKEMDAPPQLIPPGRTMVPIRFVVEGLGGKIINWDNKNQIVTIGS